MSQGKNTNFDFTKKGDEDCKSKIDVSNPEYLMDLAGSWNKYQFFQTTIFVIVVIFFTYSHYLPILYLYVPEHYCLISGGEKHNLTQEDLNNIFIPRIKNESRYENCLQYDVDVLRILENGIREPNSSWPLVSCQNGWHYEFENYYNSVASEFNFVCENSWKGPLTETVYFVGSSLGMLMYGWIGDYLGRYWTVILSNWFVCLCGMGLGFSNSYVIYTFIRFLMGISTVTTLTSFFVLAMEYVSKSKRTFIGNFSLGLGIAIAGSIMPALFYVLKDWRLVNHAMYAQVSLTFLLPFFIHESVRWLLERGQYNKAGKILEKVAKFNGRTLDKNIILELNSRDNENDDEETKKLPVSLNCLKLQDFEGTSLL
ncbi:steroid transmembrane transporter SLC22A24 [Lepeophtheirus salmonis]|uniref:steroid transmembrane transporter SLC22A24 n=1 Tax=Lepeophtheirus salmonis TaxID=72036 RepID=UPI001AE334AD|nr:steroid transmembrane transporter SLC22A24-like [Lepeophtheirus salmonis]XP_040569453.1 steroid transmembrane transporter SLC22A24-like [Lepeophtheirus salmonis]